MGILIWIQYCIFPLYYLVNGCISQKFISMVSVLQAHKHTHEFTLSIHVHTHTQHTHTHTQHTDTQTHSLTNQNFIPQLYFIFMWNFIYGTNLLCISLKGRYQFCISKDQALIQHVWLPTYQQFCLSFQWQQPVNFS